MTSRRILEIAKKLKNIYRTRTTITRSWIVTIHKAKGHSTLMNFKKWVEIIQSLGYNGAFTVVNFFLVPMLLGTRKYWNFCFVICSFAWSHEFLFLHPKFSLHFKLAPAYDCKTIWQNFDHLHLFNQSQDRRPAEI